MRYEYFSRVNYNAFFSLLKPPTEIDKINIIYLCIELIKKNSWDVERVKLQVKIHRMCSSIRIFLIFLIPYSYHIIIIIRIYIICIDFNDSKCFLFVLRLSKSVVVINTYAHTRRAVLRDDVTRKREGTSETKYRPSTDLPSVRASHYSPTTLT